MLKVKQFSFNPFGESTFVVYDSVGGDALVVDPGMVDEVEFAAFDKFIADNNLQVRQIVNTHLHLDHCFGNNYVRSRYSARVAAHPADAPLGASLVQQAAMFGIRMPKDAAGVQIDVPLADGDTIAVGPYTLQVLHTPGHSPGGIVLYSAEGKFAIVGDSIFRGSIGRTDLQGGDHATLIHSVLNKILTLPDDTRLLPGHGPMTTVATERTSNPFLR